MVARLQNIESDGGKVDFSFLGDGRIVQIKKQPQNKLLTQGFVCYIFLLIICNFSNFKNLIKSKS